MQKKPLIMTDLLKIYNDLFQDKDKWKYYTQLNINPFESNQESRDFITRFIELSGKSEENPLFDNIQKLDDKRIRHIVSIFFLGTYFYHNSILLKGLIDKTISRFKKQNPQSKIEFSFIWFLICLFHDLGYTIEDNERFDNFESFINSKIKYFLNQRVGVPFVYEKTFKDYFNYRLNSNNAYGNRPDHGICGGILLFNKLNSILIKKQTNNNSEGLSWNKKLINIYRFASWVILSHNIYFIRKGNPKEQDYLENNLQDLILEKNEKSKISLKNHTFLYLFLLMDSIDPIKIFDNYENLRDIEIECVDKEIKIDIKNELFQNEYIKRVNDLKDWLIPGVKYDENKITITMN